jgi:single-strand DNA-binding protein
MNKFIATGNLGKDCTTSAAGTTKVINFSIAVTSGYGDNKKTFWLEVSKFGDNIKLSEYLLKGQQVIVIGELSIRTWEKDGKSGTSICLRADEVQLIGGKQDATPQPQTTAPQKTTQIEEPQDLPF